MAYRTPTGAQRRALAERLIAYRTKRGMYQDEFAKLLGIGRSSLSHFETKKAWPDRATLGKIVAVIAMTAGTQARRGR